MSLKTCHWESFLMAAKDGLRLCMDLVATQHVTSARYVECAAGNHQCMEKGVPVH